MDRKSRNKAGKAVGVAGSIYAVVFMLVWCGLAASMGAWIMLVFGVPFLGFMIFRLVMCLKIAKSDRPQEPWEQQDRQASFRSGNTPPRSNDYCPYCGKTLEEDFEFCPKCGRRQN